MEPSVKRVICNAILALLLGLLLAPSVKADGFKEKPVTPQSKNYYKAKQVGQECWHASWVHGGRWFYCLPKATVLQPEKPGEKMIIIPIPPSPDLPRQITPQPKLDWGKPKCDEKPHTGPEPGTFTLVLGTLALLALSLRRKGSDLDCYINDQEAGR